MDTCAKCERNANEVKLLDALDDKEVIKICEECAFSENIPILRKPTSFQLKESERPYSVRQRLSRMAGIKEENKEDISNITKKIMQNINIDTLRKRDLRKEMDDKFKSAVERNKPLNLVDNYNWLILMERKKRKIMRNQLAEAIGESEEIIKMIENKELPDDALKIIQKIEQYLFVRLRKETSNSVFPSQKRENKPVEIRHVEAKTEENELKTRKIEWKKEEPVRILRFDPVTANKLTIHDLQRMKEAREKAAKEEQNYNVKKEIKKELNFSEMIWQAKRNKEEGFLIEEKNQEDLGEVEFEE